MLLKDTLVQHLEPFYQSLIKKILVIIYVSIGSCGTCKVFLNVALVYLHNFLPLFPSHMSSNANLCDVSVPVLKNNRFQMKRCLFQGK